MDKKTRNILVLPIEVKVREFLPKLFLAYHVVNSSKFNVYIGGQRFITRKYSPNSCIWFDKFTYAEDRKDVPYHKKNDVVLQDEEGPISYHASGTIHSRYTVDQKKFVKHFIFSGTRDIENIKYLKLKEKKIFGTLKLDLLKKKQTIYNDEVKIIKKRYKNYLFVPGHTSKYRSTKQTKFIFKDVKKGKEVVNREKKVQDNYLELVKVCIEIAKSNPKLTVIFRRHPNETDENLKELFKNKPKNIKLVYKFTVTPWIIASDYYLHAGCQTSLEAIALKKKIITFIPNKISPEINFQLTKPFFRNRYQCLKFFNKKRRKITSYEISKKVTSIALNLDKKSYYVEKFIEFLNKNYRHDMGSKIKKRKKNKRNFFIDLFMKCASRIKIFLVRNDIYLSFIPKKYYIDKNIKEKKFKSLSLVEIKSYIKILQKINKDNKNIKIKKMSESAFLMSK